MQRCARDGQQNKRLTLRRSFVSHGPGAEDMLEKQAPFAEGRTCSCRSVSGVTVHRHTAGSFLAAPWQRRVPTSTPPGIYTKALVLGTTESSNLKAWHKAWSSFIWSFVFCCLPGVICHRLASHQCSRTAELKKRTRENQFRAQLEPEQSHRTQALPVL